MKSKTVMMLVLIAMSAVALPGNAQDSGGADDRDHRRGGHHRPMDEFGNPERMLSMLKRHLQLDSDQSQAVENILAAARPEIEALRDKIRAGHDALRDLDVDAPDYGSQLQNLATEMGALTSEAALLHGRVRADVFAVLTPEQRELAATARGNPRGRRGRHKPPGEASSSEF